MTINHIPQQDPLASIQTEGSRALFMEVSQLCVNHPYDQVLTVAANLVINVLRQQCATPHKAQEAWDELSAKIKGILMDHYLNGERRNVFPYNQTIEMPLFRAFRRKE